MAEFEESRKLEISNVVIHRDELRKIAKLADDAIPSSGDGQRRSAEFTLLASGARSYTAGDAALIDEDDIFSRGWVYEMSIRVSDYTDAKTIRIDVMHEERDYLSRSQVRVAGRDRQWVAGTMANFEDLIQSLDSQSMRSKANRMMARIAAFISTFLACLLIGGVILESVQSRGEDTRQALSLIISIAAAGFASWAALTVGDKIDKLWPIVEMQTTLRSMDSPAQRRRRLRAFGSSVVLPLTISLVAGAILAVGL